VLARPGRAGLGRAKRRAPKERSRPHGSVGRSFGACYSTILHPALPGRANTGGSFGAKTYSKLAFAI
jgi:hypothetical protein